MDTHADWLFFVDVEFDKNFLVLEPIEGNFEFGDDRGVSGVLDNEECFDLFPKLVLIEQKVAFRRVLSSHPDDFLKQVLRNIFELQDPSEIEATTGIPQIVVNSSINVENSHEVVVVPAAESDLVDRLFA